VLVSFKGYACCRFTRSALWVGATSFLLLGIPVVFEQERFNLEQQQQQHQRQVKFTKLYTQT